MSIQRNYRLHWYKKTAVSGVWFLYVQAANEEEVRWMHTQDLAGGALLAEQYSGPYTVEIQPPGFVLPARHENISDSGQR